MRTIPVLVFLASTVFARPVLAGPVLAGPVLAQEPATLTWTELARTEAGSG